MLNSLTMFTDADTLQNISNIVRLHYYLLLHIFEELIIYVRTDHICLQGLYIKVTGHNLSFPLSQHFVPANLQTVFHNQSVDIFITPSTYKITYYQT